MSKKTNAMKRARSRAAPKHLGRKRKGHKNPLFGAPFAFFQTEAGVTLADRQVTGILQVFQGLLNLGIIPETAITSLKPADLETMETPEGVQ